MGQQRGRAAVGRLGRGTARRGGAAEVAAATVACPAHVMSIYKGHGGVVAAAAATVACRWFWRIAVPASESRPIVEVKQLKRGVFDFKFRF